MTDEQKIRDLIDQWERASETGDLDTQLRLMTDDVTFLTAGNPPMYREQFITGFTRMMQTHRMTCRSDLQEITISGGHAVTWNHLRIEITPLAGGPTILRTGHTLTVLKRGAGGQWRIWRDANMLGPA